MAVMQGQADAEQCTAFGATFQVRVKRLLLHYADDPSVVHVSHIPAAAATA